MPQVGKKKYPYTKKGKAAAAKARKKQKETGAQKRLRDVQLAHIAGEVPLTHSGGPNLKLPKSLRRTKGGAAEPAEGTKQKAKRRKGPMPKADPEFAKELKEGNEPKQLKSKGLSKGALEYQRRQEEAERTELAEEREKGHEEYAAQLREWGVTTEDPEWPLRLMEGVNKDRRLVAARVKARQDRKKRQGTMGAAPKKETTRREREVGAADQLKKKKKKRGRKMVTKKSMRVDRHFRGRG